MMMVLAHKFTNAFGDPANRVKGLIGALRYSDKVGLLRMHLQIIMACDTIAGRLLSDNKHQVSPE